jgi:hypothetical protein
MNIEQGNCQNSNKASAAMTRYNTFLGYQMKKIKLTIQRLTGEVCSHPRSVLENNNGDQNMTTSLLNIHLVS